MDNIKEENLEKLRAIKQTAENDLKIEPGNEKNVVQNVKLYGMVNLINKKTGEKEQFEVSTVETYDYETDEVKAKIYLNGEKADIMQLIRDYEDINSIKDLIENLNREQENGKQNKEEKIKEKIIDLNELETEKEMEEYAKTAGIDPKKVKKVVEIKKQEEQSKEYEEPEVDERELESVNHLQEIKGNIKVNNHQTIEQALGMTGVRKFVVIYSEDTEKIARNNDEKNVRNNSRYSMIAVMNDGRTININDKLELSHSEGTNSTEGRIQTDADGITRKEYHEASIYNIKGKSNVISIENDTLGEIQVYYGAMTRGAYGNEANQFVGTQLETNNVWPTSREVREQECNREGIYHTDEKAKEVNEHLEHGDEEIEDIENADGDENTVELCDTEFIPGTKLTWKDLANKCGYRGIDCIEKAQKVFLEYKDKYSSLDNEDIVDKIEDDMIDGAPSGNKNR